jgi:hypothetical protein
MHPLQQKLLLTDHLRQHADLLVRGVEVVREQGGGGGRQTVLRTTCHHAMAQS